MSKTKLQRKALSLSEKLTILQKYDKRTPQLTQQQFAVSLSIPSSTLRGILKKRKEIEAKAALCGGSSKKKLKTPKHENLEKVLVEWFHQARSCNLPVNGPIIREKAVEIAANMGIEDFTAGGGWLDRFKNRHGLVYKQSCGESYPVNQEEAEFWRSATLPQLVKEYEPRDIFNADEFGLFFKLMPDKYHLYKNEKCHEGRMSKDRLTVLLCVNADGTEKLRPLVIGNYEKPRCFKNVRSFPCDYSAHMKAWMTGDLFTAWLHELDKKMEEANRKILLFIDNCPSHPKGVELKRIKIEFLPANSTRALQPLNQGIIRVTKQKYRKLIVQRYLRLLDHPHFNTSDLKLNVLDAMHYVVSSWNEVKVETIVNCFYKVGLVKQPIEVTGKQESDDEGWTELQVRVEQPGNFENFVEFDDGLVTSEPIKMEDMIQYKDTNSDSEEEDRTPLQSVTKSEALDAIETLRCFLSAKTGIDDATFLRLSYLEHAVIASRSTAVQQTTIDDFLISVLKLTYNNNPSVNKN